MPRLRDPHTGSVVEVDEETAAVLADSNYTPLDGQPARTRKTTAKKAASSNTEK